MKTNWPMRRPLFPVAVAGLIGTVIGLGFGKNPWIWLGLAGAGAAFSVWGPKRGRTAAIWFFILCTFALYTGSRAYAPDPQSIRARTGEKGGTARFEGILVELPAERVWSNGKKALEAEFRVERIESESGWEPCPGKVLMRIDPAPEIIPVVGDLLRVGGYLTLPEGPKNPGEFDRRKHLRSQGLDYLFRVHPADLENTGRRESAWLERLAAGLRAHMLRATSLGLEKDPEAAGLIAGMLFGYRDGVGQDLREAFRNTGTLHLFAVSGQNLAVVAGMLLWILAVTGAVRWRWAWMTLPAVFIFCLATGMQASAARAFVMTSVLYVGWVIGRPMDAANWLGASLLALLIWDPLQVGDAGFQLSFLVVAGLMVFSASWQKKIVDWGRADPWIPRRLVAPWRRGWTKIWLIVATAVASSAAAWTGSLIPGLFLFHQIIPVALAANVVAAPMAAGVTVLAAISSLVAPFFSVGSVGLNLVNARLVHFLAAALGWMATWPGGHFSMADPRAWFDHGPWVKVLAVEGSAPTLISGAGGKWLLEPGSTKGWGNSLRPFLNWHGIQGLDGVGLMAGTAERMAGAMDLMEGWRIGWWAETGLGGKSGALKSWRGEMEKSRIGRRFWRVSDQVRLGEDWTGEILWPPAGDGGQAEENGIVLRLSCGEARLLWAGAISGAVERELVLAHGDELRADILIQGPSKSMEANLSRAWLEMVRPKTIVRWERGLEDDSSLSVDFADLTWLEGVEVLKLKETGCLTLRPDPEKGIWRLHSWTGR